jgi:signal transduction histidine kinase
VRRRILGAIIGVTAMATLVLTVPLALIIARRESADSVRELERVAQRAASRLPTSIGVAGERIELPKVEENVQIGVYLPDGTLVAGSGPSAADRVTTRARRLTVDGSVGDQRVLADPVFVDERLIGIVRVAEPVADTAARVRHDIFILVAFDLAAVLIAALVGWFVAARLARPVRMIRDDAVRLGDGDFSIEPRHSGIAELDDTAAALAETAGRLEAVLLRERAFSVDASHQLRTPLAALRLLIETENLDPRPDHGRVLDEALIEIDRLEGTMTTLLDAARDRPSSREPMDVDGFMSDLRARWNDPLALDSRPFRCTSTGHVQAHISRPVLDQILDILIGNAADHGAGAVDVRLTDSSGGMVVTVRDAGRLGRDPGALFARRDPGATGHGVGLSLARSLAEAEGGRLVVASSQPTVFRLVLPDAAPATSPA